MSEILSFISLLKQRLTDTFIQNWRARLEESSRANFYKVFAIFQLQPYLDKLSISKFIQALSRLRMSSHRLEVESGRWVKPVPVPFNERKCTVCHVFEDEYHFVLECSLYLDLRKKYISKYFWSRPNMFKFLELLNSSNTSCIRKLCCYIFHSFKLRTEFLYRSQRDHSI